MKKISDLHGKNIVVFDCEIRNSIGKNGVTWGTHDKMGISVACLYDYRTGDTTVYLDDNIRELGIRLASADLIVGYNTIGFDNLLVEATLFARLTLKNYDMCAIIQKELGKRVKLNDVLAATFGMQKTEDGADAPIFYQEGKMGKLISYCLSDVRRERMAFESAYVTGELKTSYGAVKMRCPLES